MLEMTMLKNAAGPDGCWSEGETYEATKALAQQFVDVDAAESEGLKKKKSKPDAAA